MAIDYPRDDQNDIDVRIARTTFQNHNFLAPAKDQHDMVLFTSVVKQLQNGQIPTGLMTTTTDLEISCIDTNGERSEYTQQCHGLLARHRNKVLGRHDHFWTRGGPDQAALCDDPDDPKEAIANLAEMFARPVEQGLVEEIEHWKGAKIMPDQWGEPMVIHPVVLDDRATYRQPIKFTPMPPVVLQRHYSLDECIRLVNEAIQERVDFLNETRLERTGKSTVLGRRGCMELDPLSIRDQPRREPLPHFIGKNHLVKAAMLDLRAKRAFYYECRDLFRGPDKDVVFAAGTVMMRKLGAYCDPLPPSQIPFPPWEFIPPPEEST